MILENLTPAQIWKIQDVSRKSNYSKGSTVILYHCPTNKSCFKKSESNHRTVGSYWKVIDENSESVLCELIPEKNSKYPNNRPRHSIHKKYLIDLQIWRDIQLEYLFSLFI